MSEKYDFSGWATRANIRCSDGRTILADAFKDCDGLTVPLVWNHSHNDPTNVLGHALLVNTGDGVYTYATFNDTEKGQEAKKLVQHGDVKSLSIYANNLVQSRSKPPCDVIHGMIREVSLVLAGANKGAFIDNVSFAHSADGDDYPSEAIIMIGSDAADIEMAHAEGETFMTVEDVLDTLDEDQMEAVGQLIDYTLSHTDDDDLDDNATVSDVLETLTDKQKAAVGLLIQQMVDGADTNSAVRHSEDDDYEDDSYDDFDESDDVDDADYDDYDDEEIDEDNIDDAIAEAVETMTPMQQMVVDSLIEGVIDDMEDDSDMKHNVFDSYNNYETAPVLSHSDVQAIFESAPRVGSLKTAVEDYLQANDYFAHADGEIDSGDFGEVDYLFPDAKTINAVPELIGLRDDTWVKKVINGTHHTPFSRVKSIFADITEEEARARGFQKGKRKIEEVFTLLKRKTDPQTIYKKQKIDRDDTLDITSFDVVAWIKQEMRIKLEEEIARAILIGDGRNASSDDKILEAHVRPIYNDDDLFTIKQPVSIKANATPAEKADAVMDAAIRGRKEYRGSGNTVFFTTEEWIDEMLLMKDGIGHRIYKSEAELCTALRVKEILPVEVMEGQKIAIKTGQGTQTVDKDLVGVIVDLSDYNIGADKGGQTSLFDDFDIDYNAYKYLLETRMSGALVKPYSAISLYLDPQS